MLAIALAAVYGRALKSPFFYDDNATIVENSSIVSLHPIIGTREHPGPLNPAPDLPTSGRPLVNLSLAINYAVGGLNPFGYHLVNLVIHFLAAMLLWAIVRRTLQLLYFAGRFATSAGWLAMAVTMLWALHPLQTEAVIYATQRTELMMALFYLATLYCSLRYWVSDILRLQQAFWLMLAIPACLAGMASKEVMVSAPLIVLLFNRTFVSGSLPNALRRSWPLHVGLASTWILILVLTVNAPHSNTAGFGLRIAAPVWWLTQAKVFLMYLKLAIWPWPLLIHYDLPLLHTVGEASMYLIPVLLLASATLVLLWRNHSVGFLATWVFAILAPTSVVPIVTEIAAERRMYLPLAAIVILAIVGVYLLAQRMFAKSSPSGKGQAARNSPRRGESALLRVVVPAFLLAIVFGLVDVNRLNAYRDETTLWREVIHYQPENIVAHNNLADLLIHAGCSSEAIVETRAILAINPDHPGALDNLGVALSQLGRYAEAAEKLQQAVRLKPDFADAHNNLGLVFTNTGHHHEAIQEFQASLALKPNDLKSLFNLGIAFTNMGKYPEAIEQYERILRLRPNFTDARINLGAVLSQSGKNPQAIEQFQLVLQDSPSDPNAHNNLGLLLSDSGKTDEAIRHFEQALQQGANRSDIHYNLAQAFRRVGRTNDAIAHYQAALKLKADDIQSYLSVAQSLAAINQSQEAIATARKAIEVAEATGQQAAAEQTKQWLQQYQAEMQRATK